MARAWNLRALVPTAGWPLATSPHPIAGRHRRWARIESGDAARGVCRIHPGRSRNRRPSDGAPPHPCTLGCLALLALASGCAAPPPPAAAPFARVGGPSFVAMPAAVAARVGSADGTPIAYRAQGAGEPAVVFIHDWATDAASWGGVPEALADHHRVVTLDLAGHGQSGSGRLDWTLEAYAADVRAVVLALELPRVVLVGQGMGGTVALLAAQTLGPRAQAVVTLAALRRFSTQPDLTAASLPWTDLERDFPGAVELLARDRLFAPTLAPDAAARLARDLGRARSEVAMPSLRAWLTCDLESLLASLTIPVLAIDGPEVSAEVGAALATRLPHLRTLALPAAGGAFPQIEQPGALGETLRAAVAELAPSGGPGSR